VGWSNATVPTQGVEHAPLRTVNQASSSGHYRGTVRALRGTDIPLTRTQKIAHSSPTSNHDALPSKSMRAVPSRPHSTKGVASGGLR
jgi:hypothetical protein